MVPGLLLGPSLPIAGEENPMLPPVVK